MNCFKAIFLLSCLCYITIARPSKHKHHKHHKHESEDDLIRNSTTNNIVQESQMKHNANFDGYRPQGSNDVSNYSPVSDVTNEYQENNIYNDPHVNYRTSKTHKNDVTTETFDHDVIEKSNEKRGNEQYHEDDENSSKEDTDATTDSSNITSDTHDFDITGDSLDNYVKSATSKNDVMENKDKDKPQVVKTHHSKHHSRKNHIKHKHPTKPKTETDEPKSDVPDDYPWRDTIYAPPFPAPSPPWQQGSISSQGYDHYGNGNGNSYGGPPPDIYYPSNGHGSRQQQTGDYSIPHTTHTTAHYNKKLHKAKVVKPMVWFSFPIYKRAKKFCFCSEKRCGVPGMPDGWKGWVIYGFRGYYALKGILYEIHKCSSCTK